nr:hypothetical protein [Klebsiella michiganensis]
MESLNALIQGMGLMHLGAGQAVMLLVSLLLLWLAIAGEVRAAAAAADWLRRPAVEHSGGRAGADRPGEPAGAP